MATTDTTTENAQLALDPQAIPTTGRRARKAVPTLTTAQHLGSIVNSARNTMRKDKGLNGDLDRLPL